MIIGICVDMVQFTIQGRCLMGRSLIQVGEKGTPFKFKHGQGK